MDYQNTQNQQAAQNDASANFNQTSDAQATSFTYPDHLANVFGAPNQAQTSSDIEQPNEPEKSQFFNQSTNEFTASESAPELEPTLETEPALDSEPSLSPEAPEAPESPEAPEAPEAPESQSASDAKAEEILKNMSNEEILRAFAEGLLIEKGINEPDPEAKNQMVDELLERINTFVDRAALESLPLEKLDELDQMIENDTATEDNVAELIQTSGINTDEMVAKALEKFRDIYLGNTPDTEA